MASAKNWWAPVWRGLVSDPAATHYRKMRSALWLYLFLIVHADRQTGRLLRKIRTIESETGVRRATILYWLRRLRAKGYITTHNTGRCLDIQVSKWKPLRGVEYLTHQKLKKSTTRGEKTHTPQTGMNSLNTLISSRKMPPGRRRKRDI